MTIQTIIMAMKNFGATAFRCHRNQDGFCDISFKYEGTYIPVSPDSVMEWATL